MTRSRTGSLLVRPGADQGEYLRITPQTAQWEHLHFAARRMRRNEQWQGNTGDFEYGLVVLGGVCRVSSSRGDWPDIGGRLSVFAGMPHALYLPPETVFEVTALTERLELAYGWCLAQGGYSACLVRPEQVAVEIRGGGNATRQINSIFPPGFKCHRLVAVEVYTPPGNWSSYPPHKHDQHRVDAAGHLLEADLEEVYFYKLDHPQGYAIQRVYTADRQLDETMVAHDSEVVLVPEGYHPVAAAPGYTVYYLNFLAGSAQSLANSDDPDHAWVKQTWREQDPRVPLVSVGMQTSEPSHT